MNSDTTQEKKSRRAQIETQLRLDGQKLDSLWMEARMAKGRTRVDIHKQIQPLREKLQKDRKEQEDLRKSLLN